VQDTAKLYDVSEHTVRRWISDGLITGYKVGSTLVRVDLNEVEARVVQVIPAAGQASLQAWRERRERELGG
jgi:excisionase family DNA binding protein